MCIYNLYSYKRCVNFYLNCPVFQFLSIAGISAKLEPWRTKCKEHMSHQHVRQPETSLWLRHDKRQCSSSLTSSWGLHLLRWTTRAQSNVVQPVVRGEGGLSQPLSCRDLNTQEEFLIRSTVLREASINSAGVRGQLDGASEGSMRWQAVCDCLSSSQENTSS